MFFRLADLDIELDTLKRQVDDLRTENEWLQKEAEKTKEESVSMSLSWYFPLDI